MFGFLVVLAIDGFHLELSAVCHCNALGTWTMITSLQRPTVFWLTICLLVIAWGKCSLCVCCGKKYRFIALNLYDTMKIASRLIGSVQ